MQELSTWTSIYWKTKMSGWHGQYTCCQSTVSYLDVSLELFTGLFCLFDAQLFDAILNLFFMASPVDLYEKLKKFKYEKKLKTKPILKLLSDYEKSTIVIIFATDKVLPQVSYFLIDQNQRWSIRKSLSIYRSNYIIKSFCRPLFSLHFLNVLMQSSSPK